MQVEGAGVSSRYKENLRNSQHLMFMSDQN